MSVSCHCARSLPVTPARSDRRNCTWIDRQTFSTSHMLKCGQDRQCTYKVTYCDLCCSVNAALRYLFIMSRMPLNGTKTFNVAQLCLLTNLCRWRKQNVLKSSWKFRMFLSDYNQVWSVSTNFDMSLKYEISPKSVLWKPGWQMAEGQTDRLTDSRMDLKLVSAFHD
jgi:hypothetical protein